MYVKRAIRLNQSGSALLQVLIISVLFIIVFYNMTGIMLEAQNVKARMLRISEAQNVMDSTTMMLRQSFNSGLTAGPCPPNTTPQTASGIRFCLPSKVLCTDPDAAAKGNCLQPSLSRLRLREPFQEEKKTYVAGVDADWNSGHSWVLPIDLPRLPPVSPFEILYSSAVASSSSHLPVPPNGLATSVTMGALVCPGDPLCRECGSGGNACLKFRVCPRWRGTCDPSNDQDHFVQTVILKSSSEPMLLSLSGNYGCVAFVNGKLKCFGRNTYSSLGTGNSNHYGDNAGEMGANLPFIDLGSGVLVKQIVTAENSNCALTGDGRIKCWGWGEEIGLAGSPDIGGAPGDMGNALPYVKDVGGVADLTDAQMIAYGARGALCAFQSDKRYLKCRTKGHHADNPSGVAPAHPHPSRMWITQENRAGNHNGAAGGWAPHTMLSYDMEAFFGVGARLKKIVMGPYILCLHLESNAVHCIGQEWFYRGSYGQGNGNYQYLDTVPTAINWGTGRSAKNVFMGDATICAILDNDRVKCIGLNDFKQAGVNGWAESPPVVGDGNPAADGMGDQLGYVGLPAGPVVDVAIGETVACALMATKEVWCWGNGNHNPAQKVIPAAVGVPKNFGFVGGGSGGDMCVITELQRLYCWDDFPDANAPVGPWAGWFDGTYDFLDGWITWSYGVINGTYQPFASGPDFYNADGSLNVSN